MNTAKLDSLKDRAFDLAFINQMIPHHEGAVSMAKEAFLKSENPEIKEPSESIVGSQDVEISKMRGWRTAWEK